MTPLVALVRDRRRGNPATAAGIRVTWTARPEWEDWARWSEGCYVLRTNILDWSPEELWRTYVQLTDAEAAFRIQKSDVALRPIWHQRADRVQAHILVCFLAYVLWKTLEQWQQRAGFGRSPRTILEELRTIQAQLNGSGMSIDLLCHTRMASPESPASRVEIPGVI